jgi:hypothetical protein
MIGENVYKKLMCIKEHGKLLQEQLVRNPSNQKFDKLFSIISSHDKISFFSFLAQ